MHASAFVRVTAIVLRPNFELFASLLHACKTRKWHHRTALNFTCILVNRRQWSTAAAGKDYQPVLHAAHSFYTDAARLLKLDASPLSNIDADTQLRCTMEVTYYWAGPVYTVCVQSRHGLSAIGSMSAPPWTGILNLIDLSRYICSACTFFYSALSLTCTTWQCCSYIRWPSGRVDTRREEATQSDVTHDASGTAV